MKHVLALGALTLTLAGCVAIPVGDPYGDSGYAPYGYSGYAPYRSDAYVYAPDYGYGYGYGYGPGYYYGPPVSVVGSFFFGDFDHRHAFRGNGRDWGGWGGGRGWNGGHGGRWDGGGGGLGSRGGGRR